MLGELVESPDVAAVWDALPLDRRRAVLQALVRDDPGYPSTLLSSPYRGAFSGIAFHCYAGEPASQGHVAALRARQEELARGWAAGALTQAQLLAADAELRTRLDEIERRVAAETQSSVLGELVESPDVAAVWDALPLDRRRAVLQALVLVTVLPRARRGRLPGGVYFDPTAVRFEWTATGRPEAAGGTRGSAPAMTPSNGFVRQMEGA